MRLNAPIAAMILSLAACTPGDDDTGASASASASTSESESDGSTSDASTTSSPTTTTTTATTGASASDGTTDATTGSTDSTTDATSDSTTDVATTGSTASTTDSTDATTDDTTTGGVDPCVAPILPGTIDYRSPEYSETEAHERLSHMIADAAEDPIFTPPAYPMGYGPTAKQGVVRIPFDPDAPPYEGANAIVLHGTVDFVSGVRLEIDSGIRLVDAQPKDGTLISWRGAPDQPLTDVTLTVGDTCHGEGWAQGRFVVDRQTALDPALATRFLWAENADRWLLEHVHTLDHPLHYDTTPMMPGGGTGGPVVLFRGSTPSTVPRHGVYRHHSNEGSCAGWGPNQIAALEDTYISHIKTDGGTALRFESSQLTPGNHRITAEYIFGMNGNGVVSFSPHESSSDEVHVSQLYGVSMYAGITIVKGEGGVFTKSSASDGCIVGGHTAESSAADKPYPGSDDSKIAIYNVGSGVTVSGIGSAGDFLPNGSNGDPDVPCSLDIAMNAF
ncbi:MAG: hypothetical protein R3B09_11430 [Nannocystaceae bacterium]